MMQEQKDHKHAPRIFPVHILFGSLLFTVLFQSINNFNAKIAMFVNRKQKEEKYTLPTSVSFPTATFSTKVLLSDS